MERFRRARWRAATMAGAISLAVTDVALSIGPVGATTVKHIPVNVKALGSDYGSPRCVNSPYKYCLWYSPNSGGSMWGSAWIHTPDINYTSAYLFRTAGAGQGQYVRNNAASFASGVTCSATVYYYTNFRGPSQTVGGGQGASLNPTMRNEDASIQLTNC